MSQYFRIKEGVEQSVSRRLARLPPITASLMFLGAVSLIIYFIYTNREIKGLQFLEEDIPSAFSKSQSPTHVEENGSKVGVNDTRRTHVITIITAYFYFRKSKHKDKEYEEWMANFLPTVDTPMVIFTQPSEFESMSKLREGKPTHIILNDEIWDLPWMNNDVYSNKSLRSQYQDIKAKDPEAAIHSPELYAIWNSKPWMLSHVSKEINPFNSTYFYWMDIGSVRNSNNDLTTFLNVEKAMQVFGSDQKDENFDKFQVFSVQSFHNYKPPPGSNTFEEMSKISFVIGGFFGGTRFGIEWFSSTFYKTHDDLMMQGYFVGKDQSIYNWMATHYPDQMLIVCSCPPQEFFCEDDSGDWFYFQRWYMSKDGGESCKFPSQGMDEFLLQQMNMKNEGK